MYVKPKRNIHTVFLHCSASDNPAHDNAATMNAWHLEKGYAEIGYHFFIRKNGMIEAGRSLEKTPAAQAPHNTGTIAICVHGLNEKNFTQAQKDAVVSLCKEINAAHGKNLFFRGHREVANKLCPVFDYKSWLGIDKFRRMTK